MAGWERYYGYSGGKRGEKLNNSQNPQPCWKTCGQWPYVLVGMSQASANMLIQQTQGRLLYTIGKAEMWGYAGSEEGM